MENVEKKIYIVDNQLPQEVGIEIYYFHENEVKCECEFISSCNENYTVNIEYDVYQISFFYLGRFHYVSKELLNRKIKSIEFPFFLVNLNYQLNEIKITLSRA